MKALGWLTALFVAFTTISAKPAEDKKDDDGYVPMFNGKDLTGWVNVNCAPEHLLRQGRRGHHHRPSDRLSPHDPSNTRTSSPSSTGCTSTKRTSATPASSSGPIRCRRSARGLHARHRGAGARQPGKGGLLHQPGRPVQHLGRHLQAGPAASAGLGALPAQRESHARAAASGTTTR